jgi:drug/metabolite transporter (DMT)-like permease
MVAVGSSVAAATALVAYPIASGQALRYGLAGALLVAFARGRLPRLTGRQTVRLLALAATGLAGFNAFLIAAVREADAGSVGVIVGCVPIALALAGPLLERRAVRPRVVAAAVAVSAGAAAVQWAGGSMSLAGVALSLGALACEAAFTLLALPLIATLGARSVSAYACLFAVPLLLAMGLVLDGRGLLRSRRPRKPEGWSTWPSSSPPSASCSGTRASGGSESSEPGCSPASSLSVHSSARP